jgi:hypothetical protein
MAGYVIQQTKDGAYVAPQGSRTSYVKALQHARVYSTRDEAARDLCTGNERILSVEQAISDKS